jgi:tetratricopeptide (TPR) repeat protein
VRRATGQAGGAGRRIACLPTASMRGGVPAVPTAQLGSMEASVSEQDMPQNDEQNAGATSFELSAGEQAELASLEENLAKFEGLKRWSDVIKTLIAKGDLLKNPAQKIASYARAGELFIEKSSNQAEAIKCYQKVLEVDPRNLDAITRLKDMYEKRRDWERLVDVMKTETQLLAEEDRMLRYVEIAELATQRLRKPEVCIELWQSVLEFDDSNPQAIEALAGLYEKAREWESLAKILEKQSAAMSSENDLVNLLLKLGGLYADKLSDDRGAVRAFERLLALRPEERRAQEQLKKRYAALRDWNALEVFYANLDKWDELIRVFEREADDTNVATDERIGLLKRVAGLWAEKKDKPDRAGRAYEKILELDPDNLDAAVALSPIYEQGRDPKKLAAVYEVRLKHVEELEERLLLLRETGLIYEEKTKEPETAFAKYLEAFSLAPTRDVTREDVARLAGAVEGGWDKVVAAYEFAIAAATDPLDMSELRLSAGQVLSQVGRVDDAIKQLAEVYDAEPDNMRAAQALEPLYRQTGRFRDVLEIYRKRQDMESDPRVRRELAYQIAALQENELQKPDEAVDGYRQILTEYGDDEVEAYRALERLFESLSRHEELADTLSRRIDLGPSSDEELAALKFRLALVKQQHLKATAEAVELYREILMLLPEHEGARQKLELLLDDERHGRAAAEILEPMYETAGQWEQLVRALEVLVKGASEPEERLGLLSKIGQVCAGPIGDPGRSFDAFMLALREMPSHPETLQQLEVLAIEQDRFAELVALVVELASNESDPILSRALYLKAAEHYATQLGDMEGAVRCYNQILEFDPGDDEVLDALERLYRIRERWPDLVSVMRRKVELTADPAVKEQLLAQMADVHQQYLQQPLEAIARYREILELDPTSARALSALGGLYESQAMWSELADNVSRELELADDVAYQTSLMLRLAALREQRMDAVESAIDMYREVLQREPTNASALTALERLMQNPAHELAIAEVLEPLYRDVGEFQKLIDVHEIQARHAGSVEQKVELLHTVAELYEVQVGDLDRAVTTHARALAEDPANEVSQAQLERVALAANQAERLAQVYEAEVERVEDPAIGALLHVKAAQIRENMLNDVPAAVAHYKRVLELDATHLEAASALERLYQHAGEYEALAQIYLTKAAMLPELEEQKQHFYRAAQIYEEVLAQPLAAVDVFKRVLELDAEDTPSLDKLIELYLRLERWEDLLAIYTRKADIVGDPDEKKTIYAQVGAVYERELNDKDRAIDIYQRILEVDPDDMSAIGRLDALYLATENWLELMSILEREVDLTSDPYEAVGYRYRIAELWDKRLEDSARAVEGFREILELLPDHAPTLQALEAMIGAGREPLAAAEVLDPVYRQLGEWGKLSAVQEVRIAHESDPIRKVELLQGLAELFEVQLDNARSAFEAYGRSLSLDPQNEHTQQSLERLGETLGAWQDVTRLYDQAIAQLKQAGEGAELELALRAAQILEIQLEDVPAAIAHYRLVVDVDAGHAQALEALDRLYESTGGWENLADVLRKEIEVAPTPDDMLNLQFRLGQVMEKRLGRVEDAVAQYRDIIAAAPEYQAAVQALETLFAQGHAPMEIGEVLEPLYRMQGAWTALVGVHEVQLMHQADPIERVAMMHRVAEIAEDKAGDSRLAFLWMQRALLEEPLNEHTDSEVERLARVTDGWAVLANTYADVVSNGAGGDVKVSLGRKLARIYEDELADVERAEESYRFVLGIDSSDDATLEALDRIYTSHQSYDSLAEVLRLRVKAAESDYDRTELSFRLGQVLEVELGRVDEAIATYQQILSVLDPEHADSIDALERAFTTKGDWVNLYATYEKALKVVVGDSNQADIYAKMARLASEHLGQVDAAIDTWKQVLELRGEDPEALRALGQLYEGQQNYRDLVDILEREVSVAESDEERIRIFSQLGRVWYERLDRARSALENWERVLDIDPGRTEALFAIAAIHRAANDHQDLVDTLHRVIDAGASSLEDTQIEQVYVELGQLYETQLQRPVDAVEAYAHAVDVNLRNFAAMDAMERIHTESGDWEARIGVKERRVTGLSEASDKVSVLLDIARSWAEDGEQRKQGVSALNRVLELEPLHESAFQQLEEIHTDDENWEALVDLYVTRVEAVEDVQERIRLLHKVAKINEDKLGEAQQAFDALLVAWGEDYQHQRTANELERLASGMQGWGQLLTVANEALQQELPQDVRIAICMRCAKWYGKHLERPDYAIPYYQQILQLDPVNAQAMSQMADLYRQTGQWETVYQVLSRMLEVSTTDEDKMDAYVQLGELCEKHLGRPEQATAYYRQALDLDGAHLGALIALERIYRERGEWDELVEVLKRKASFRGGDLTELSEEDVEVVLAAKLELADAYRDHFNDIDKAIVCYEEVLKVEPQNLIALRGIEPLYQQRERWQDLPGVLEAQLEAVGTEKERITTLLKLARLYEVEFVKPERAAERLEQVLDIDPNHLDALAGLARIYRTLQRWDDVIGTYERHVSAASARADKIAIYKALGEVYAAELKDYGRAIDTYLNVTNIDESDTAALEALARLYERTEDASSQIDCLERLAALVREPAQQVELEFRMGRVLEDKLGDRAAAVTHYERAIDVDPAHLPSLEAMRKVYIDNGDWLAAARTLEREVEHQQNPRVLTRLYVELGQIYRERLDEHARSIGCFEAALKHDDTNEEAALPLVDDYLGQERWEAALPLLTLLVKTGSRRSPDENHRLCFLQGQAAARIGNHALAVKAYGQAYTLDPSHLPTIQGLAAAHFAMHDWEKAGKFYQVLLMQHRDDLSPEEVTQSFHQLGVIRLEQGDRRKALNMFDKALEQDAMHRDTLARVITIHAEDGGWDQVIHYKKQLLEGASLPERLKLLQEISDLWRDKLDNRQKAIEHMVEAVGLEPKNHVLLHKLLQLYQETKLWKEATEIIQRIADLDERSTARAKYAYTIGVILRDELKDVDGALLRFNDALDLDPTQLKPFEAINKLLTQMKDWKNLERAFRKMLHRVMAQPQPDKDLQFNLSHTLGLIYRDRLKQFEAAAQAFKMASDLKPQDQTEHQILAEIYARLPNKFTDAVEEYEYLLRQDPLQDDSYQALYKLYFDNREYDKAWCVARTLTFMKKADHDQAQFFEQYKVASGNPSARLSAQNWLADLYHPEQDKELSMVFRSLCQPLFDSRYSTVTDKMAGLSKLKPVDLTKETASFAQAFALAMQVLSPDVRPRLFLRGDVPSGIRPILAQHPASECGALLLRGHKPKELQFAAAHHLAYHRAEHYIRRMLPARQELRDALFVALRCIGEGPADAEKPWEVMRQRMQPAQVEELAKACKLFVSRGARTDIKRYIQAVELTACRAGFLVCNDLEASIAMLPQLESAGPDDSTPNEKTKELLLFSVSREYFRLREAIGITLRLQ